MDICFIDLLLQIIFICMYFFSERERGDDLFSTGFILEFYRKKYYATIKARLFFKFHLFDIFIHYRWDV